MPALVVLALVAGVVRVDAGTARGRRQRHARHPQQAIAASGLRTVRVVAAGDIACPPGLAVTPTQCQQGATAALARRLNPRLVLTLGDHQYNKNTLAAQFSRHLHEVVGDAAAEDATGDRQPRVPDAWRQGLLLLLPGPGSPARPATTG